MPYIATILVVDDSPVNLRLLSESLNRENYRVIVADSGQAAIDAVQIQLPDLILLDICMPDMDGYDVCKHFKSVRLTADIPIIFISALNDATDKIKGLQLGAVDYITKPFDIDEVRTRVKTQIELHFLRKKMQDEIDAHKLAEDKLQAALEHSHALLELNPDLIFIYDQNGVYQECHTASSGLLYRPKEDLIGKNIKDILPPAIADLLYSSLQKAYTENSLQVAEYPMTIDDNEMFFEARIVKFSENRLMAVVRDITKEKLNIKLQQLNSTVLSILNSQCDFGEAVSSLLFTIKEEFKYDAVGLRFKNLADFPYFAQHGFADDFLLMENSLIEKDDRGGVCRDENGNIRLECTCGAVLMEKTDTKYPFFTEKGSFWTNNSIPLLDVPLDLDPRLNPRNNCIHKGYASVALIPIHAAKQVIGLLQLNCKKTNRFNLEIIHLFERLGESIGIAFQRKQAEETLRQSEDKYRAITENSTDFILQFDRDYRYIFGNSAAQSVVGLSYADFVGKSHAELGFPEHLCRLFDESIEKVFKTGCEENLEFEVELLNRKRVLDLHLFPEFSTKGTVISVFGISRDMTHRKAQEMERLEIQKQLMHSQKLESIGILSGGIAHDFNNILAVVLGNLDYLSYLEIQDQEIIRYINRAKEGVDRAAFLTKQLMAYAGHAFYELKEQNINSQLEHYKKHLKTVIAPQIDFSINLCPKQTIVRGDRSHLDQVLIHLLTNASESIGNNQGCITLSTAVRDFSSLDLNNSLLPVKPEPGRFVCIEVNDNGCGMDETTLAKVFEPFFSTKFTGRGMGMASVQGILIAHRGGIFIDSKVGEGTKVTVLLPLLQSESSQPEAPVLPLKSKSLEQFSGTLIVADDEEMVLDMNAAILRKFGFEVLTANNGKTAVNLFEKNQSKICGVVLDLAMPEMDGLTAAKAIRAISPDVKILTISGYDPSDEAFKIAQKITDGFLQKPFNLQQLKTTLNTVFGNN